MVKPERGPFRVRHRTGWQPSLETRELIKGGKSKRILSVPGKPFESDGKGEKKGRAEEESFLPIKWSVGGRNACKVVVIEYKITHYIQLPLQVVDKTDFYILYGLLLACFHTILLFCSFYLL